jgi:hypothetical protein
MYSTSIINNDEDTMKRAKGWNQRSYLCFKQARSLQRVLETLLLACWVS